MNVRKGGCRRIYNHLTRTISYTCLCLFGLLTTQCTSTRQVVYFQQTPGVSDTARIALPYNPPIRPGDVLNVQVSSLNPEATLVFNPSAAAASNSASTGSALPAMNGYLVSPTGTITLPIVGSVLVGGLTTEQSSVVIREKVSKQLKEPTVSVRNQNFRISVMGEVARPALFVIPNDQITLLEALSLAGDITLYGRRNNVLVVRETNGRKEYAYVDLTRRALFQSPYYYLHPNDVVYVEPSRARVASGDRTNQAIPILLSALSFLTVLVTQLTLRR